MVAPEVGKLVVGRELFGGGALVITAVLVWNVAQHAMSDEAPSPSVVPAGTLNGTSR